MKNISFLFTDIYNNYKLVFKLENLSLNNKTMIILETREAEIGGYYFLMIIGAIGMIAIAIYIIVSILLYLKKRKKQKTID
jgi:thiosulfate reductase cytochrome b subunit